MVVKMLDEWVLSNVEIILLMRSNSFWKPNSLAVDFSRSR